MAGERYGLGVALACLSRGTYTPSRLRVELDYLHTLADRDEILAHLPQDAPAVVRTTASELRPGVRQVSPDKLRAAVTAYGKGGRHTSDRRSGQINSADQARAEIARVAAAYGRAIDDPQGSGYANSLAPGVVENQAAYRFARSVGSALDEFTRADARAVIPADLSPRLASIVTALLALLLDDEQSAAFSRSHAPALQAAIVVLVVFVADLAGLAFYGPVTARPHPIRPPREAASAPPAGPRAPSRHALSAA